MRKTVLLLTALTTAACATDAEGLDDGKSDGSACSSKKFGHIRDAIQVAGAPETPGALVATQANRLDPVPLIGGPAIFKKMADLIATAQSEVTFETWLYHVDGDPSRTLIDGIKRLNQRRIAEKSTQPPVTVYLLINYAPINPVTYLADIYVQLKGAAVDPAHVNIVLASYKHMALGANHSKTLTIDGHTAVIAGTNATADNGGPVHYHDTAYLVEGDVALAIRDTFSSIWMADQAEEWKCAESWQTAVNDPAICWSRSKPLPKLSRPNLAKDACTPALVTTRKAAGGLFAGDTDDDSLGQTFLTAAAVAEKRILIQTPNLNEPAMMDALLAAAKGGVQVDVVLSKNYEDFAESLPGRGGTNDESVEKMYKAMAGYPDACDRLRIRWFSRDGVNPNTENGPPTSHMKYMSVDSELAIVGSSNHDVQSWRNSREIAVVVDDDAIVSAWDGSTTFERAVPPQWCPRR